MEPATSRLLAQCLNQIRYRAPPLYPGVKIIWYRVERSVGSLQNRSTPDGEDKNPATARNRNGILQYATLHVTN
jgi:hypothetical protein